MWILRLEYKRRLRGALLRGMIAAAVLLALIALYHVFRMEIYWVTRTLGRLPEELAALAGFREGINLSNHILFYDFLLVWFNLYFAYYAVCLGGEALHGEEQTKSIFYILARPVAKWQLVLWKLISSLTAYLAATGLPLLISCLCFWLIGENAVVRTAYLQHIWNTYLGQLLMGCVFMAVGFFYSSLAGKESYTGDFGVTVVAGTTLAGLIPELFNLFLKIFLLAGKNISKMQPLSGRLSYFNLLSPAGWANPLRNAGKPPDIQAVLAGGAVILVLLILTFMIYNRKEFD